MDKAEKELIKTELEDGNNKPAPSRAISDDEREFIELAHKRFLEFDDAYKDAQEAAREDIDFIVEGKQWDEQSPFVKDRRRKGLPCLVFNHGLTAIDNLAGEIRQNLPRVKYRGVDSKTDPKQAEIRTSILRHIDEQSKAERGWYEAVKQAVLSGYPAYMRIVNEYASHDTFNQELFIRHCPYQFSVKLDPNAVTMDRPDRGGPKWGSIEEVISRAEFVQRFPDAETVSIDDLTTDNQKWWMKNEVRIASYYVATPRTVTMVKMPDGSAVEKDGEKYQAFMAKMEQQAMISGVAVAEMQEREDEKWEIRHYLISGNGILKGPEEIPGEYIPIIPVEGKYNWSDGKKKYRGVYTNAKDANRMENLWASKATEAALIGTRYLATAAMIGDNTDMWANPEGHRVLLHKWDPEAPGTRPEPDDANSMDVRKSVEMMQYSSEARKSLSVPDASMGNEGNEKSGKAIQVRDQNANQTNYEFPANLAAAMDYAATIINSMIPVVYDYPTIVKIIGDDGKEKDQAPVNQPAIQKEPGTGNLIDTILNDMSAGRFDTVIDIGPSLKTQRMEALDNMVKLAQAAPIIGNVGADILVSMMDVQGSDELSKRILATLPPAVRDAGDDDENKKMQGIISQAVEPIKQQAMQAFQAAEQKINELNQQNAQLQQKVGMATQAMKDKASEIELKRMELQLRDKEISNKTASDAFKVKGDVEMKQMELRATSAVQPLQDQINELQSIVKQFMGNGGSEKKAKPDDEKNLTVIIDNKSGQIRKTVSLTSPSGETYTGEVLEGDA